MRARYESTSPRDVTLPAVMRGLQIDDRLLVDLEELSTGAGCGRGRPALRWAVTRQLERARATTTQASAATE